MKGNKGWSRGIIARKAVTKYSLFPWCPCGHSRCNFVNFLMETSFGTVKGLKLRCKLIFILTY